MSRMSRMSRILSKIPDSFIFLEREIESGSKLKKLSISEVFHLSEVRAIIFDFKYKILYEKVNTLRERIITVNNKLCCNIEALMKPPEDISGEPPGEPEYLPEESEEPPGEPEDKYVSEILTNPHAYIHSYSLDRALNWRESAIVLGLYYML